MFKRMLFVLEPGRQADGMLETGLALARACLAELVFYTPLGRAVRPPLSDMLEEVAEAQRSVPDGRRAHADRLHAQAQRLATDQGLRSRSEIAAVSDAVRGIVDVAQESHSDVILVAGERSNAVVRLLNGSPIPGLVTAAPVPVLVCSPRSSPRPAPGADIPRFLVILEDDDTLGAVRTQALDLARELGADLLFVHVTSSGMGAMVEVGGLVSNIDERLAAEIESQSRRLLAHACRLATRMGLSARGRSLPPSMAAKDIAGLASDERCDLIVAGHRGSNALMRLLSGSVIPGLITAAEMPILICREPETPPKRPPLRRRPHRQGRGAAMHPAQFQAR